MLTHTEHMCCISGSGAATGAESTTAEADQAEQARCIQAEALET